ncbi:sulfatase [Compostibacter hankyongensis]|uniref:Sulfatase n=1 Tax=Compostibacter hankyongensis TaxID=1007089 RepID=A0ABP8FZ95_9BACT
MKKHLLYGAAVFAALFFLFSCAKEPSRKRPNILVLHADQWRAQAFGYAGDKNVKTPHIDSFAATCADFQYAVSGLPVCTPYRASFMTGQRPLTNGVFMNDVRLDTNAVTIAEVLARNGYQTGYIGKWHLDGQARLSYTPPGGRRQGFQYWKAVNCTHDYNHSMYYEGDDPAPHYWPGYDAIAETEDAVQYIKGHSGDEQPFFLMLAWGTPHAPYQTAPARYRALYDSSAFELRPNVPDSMEKQVRHDLAGYYAHMSVLDDMVGQLLNTLKEEHILDNTIVLFVSDHGDLLGSHGYYKKQRPYDESIRVPFLLHYSGGADSIRSGTYDAMINAEDVMPTLLGLCGVAVPGSVEGKDFSGYLHGGKSPKDSVAVITCIQPFGQWTRAEGGKECRGIRTPRYTYVRDLQGPWLLFDNLSDPYQMNNLTGNPQYAALQKRLDGILSEKLRVEHDAFLPGLEYVRKFNYPPLDSSETVPYHP